MTVIRILNSPKATIIPCIHEESGCSGLFNTITNEFYPVKTTEFEYIQSAETQYIDTGVQPKGRRMKRLTEKDDSLCICCGGIGSCRNDCSYKQIYDRLAKYEDMEEQGLLVRLPCKVGDTIYRIIDDCTLPGDCGTKRMCKGCEYRNLFIEEDVFHLCLLTDSGKLKSGYYPTREAAEKALEDCND